MKNQSVLYIIYEPGGYGGAEEPNLWAAAWTTEAFSLFSSNSEESSVSSPAKTSGSAGSPGGAIEEERALSGHSSASSTLRASRSSLEGLSDLGVPMLSFFTPAEISDTSSFSDFLGVWKLRTFATALLFCRGSGGLEIFTLRNGSSPVGRALFLGVVIALSTAGGRLAGFGVDELRPATGWFFSLDEFPAFSPNLPVLLLADFAGADRGHLALQEFFSPIRQICRSSNRVLP